MGRRRSGALPLLHGVVWNVSCSFRCATLFFFVEPQLCAHRNKHAALAGRRIFLSLATSLRVQRMPRMAFLEDIARRARPSPLQAWPEVEEEHEQEDQMGQLGAGHQHQDTHDNAVSTGTLDAATIPPRIESGFISPLMALGLYGRAVAGSTVSTRDHEGGVVTGTACSGRLSPCLHDARGDGHEKHKQPRLWHALKSLAIATALVAAVMVVINQGKVCISTVLLRMRTLRVGCACNRIYKIAWIHAHRVVVSSTQERPHDILDG